ncbi:MAG: PDZ domain-containing protein [Planctomycetota bacterium]|jgi:membrane-associated protease RseP (regulator of RpoE activity)
MYYTHKKSAAKVGEAITAMDCFVERTRNWFWTIIIFVFGSIVYAIVTSSGQGPAYPVVEQSIPQGGQFQNTALTNCPYCPGFLDSQGRCNVRECPIYNPNWGKPTTSNDIPVRRVLIKELALEVGASQGKASVVIQAVYAGGNVEKAGLKVGDRIVRFNGRNIKNVKQFESAVARAKPEANVKIQVIRNNKKIKSRVMIGEGEMEGVTVPIK